MSIFYQELTRLSQKRFKQFLHPDCYYTNKESLGEPLHARRPLPQVAAAVGYVLARRQHLYTGMGAGPAEARH